MLTVISGPMFAGKTSKLISMIKSNIIAGNAVEVFKPSNDDRYGLEKITTHDGVDIEAEVLDANRPLESYFIKDWFPTRAVAFFEECQFFKPADFVILVNTIMADRRNVVCAGLPNDFQGKPFGAMPQLMALADEVISLKAVCSKCKGIGIATRTFRKTKDTAQTVVGGAEMYEPRCYGCWSEDLKI